MKYFGHSARLVLLATLTLLSGPTLTAQTADPHAYFNALVARPEHWKSYSLRDSEQLDAYKSGRSKPAFVTYDYAGDLDPRRQDAAKVVIPATTNSLPNQLRLPFESEEGYSYLTTWDAWYGCEARSVFTGVTNWKTFQFDFPRIAGGRATIWAEVQTMFGAARDAPNDLARLRMRQYSSLADSLDGRDGTGSVGTDVDFRIKCETWTRYWVLMNIPRYDSGDVQLTLWAADPNRDAVKIHDRTPWRRAAPGRIEKFWLEFNTSTDAVAPGRGPIVSYVRNVVILRDVRDPAALLQRPLSTGAPSRSGPAPAPPSNLRIVR